MVAFNHRRTGRGGEGGCSPPPPKKKNFGQLRFFGQQEKILYFILTKIYSDKNPDVGRRNNQVTFSRDIGCLARDEFLVIRKGYHALIYIFINF